MKVRARVKFLPRCQEIKANRYSMNFGHRLQNEKIFLPKGHRKEKPERRSVRFEPNR